MSLTAPGPGRAGPRAGLTGALLARSTLYVLVAVGPLLLSLIQLDPGRGFWVNLSVAFGFVGLSLMGLQFVIASRTVQVSTRGGVLPLLQFHREITYLALLLIVAHPVILVLWDSRFWALLDVVHAPVRAKLAVASVVALLALVATSVWRSRLRLSYRAWQLLHTVLAVTTVVTALAHVLLIGYYVDQPWERGLWIAYTLAFLAISVWVRVVKPLQRWRRRWRVVSVEEQPGPSHRVTLELVDPGSYGPAGFRFRAGQFAWIAVGRSPFEITQHPFSFSSNADRPERIAFTVRAFGAFTSSLHDLTPGRHVYLDGPWGELHVDRHPARPLGLLAAGIGVTPAVSILETLADRGDPRPCVLVLGNRSEGEVACGDQLAALADRLDLTVVPVLSRAGEGWTGLRGRVDAETLDAALLGDVSGWQFVVCGPTAMMDAAEAWLAGRGVPREAVLAERFTMV
ncbi:ferric reductase-like transmembrane domain-containing protein [Rhodococcus aerolatus]